MRIIARLATALVLAFPAALAAAPVTFEFSGNVAYVTDGLGLDPEMAPGSTFTGSLTFDDAVPAMFEMPTVSTYLDVITDFRLQVAGAEFSSVARPFHPYSSHSSEAQAYDNRTGDGYDSFYFGTALQLRPDDPDGLFFRTAKLAGVSTDQDLFTNTLLPTSLEVGSFDYVPITLSLDYSWLTVLADGSVEYLGYGYFSGAVTSIHRVPVPEPSILGLLSGALLAVALTRRRPRGNPG